MNVIQVHNVKFPSNQEKYYVGKKELVYYVSHFRSLSYQPVIFQKEEPVGEGTSAKSRASIVDM